MLFMPVCICWLRIEYFLKVDPKCILQDNIPFPPPRVPENFHTHFQLRSSLYGDPAARKCPGLRPTTKNSAVRGKKPSGTPGTFPPVLKANSTLIYVMSRFSFQLTQCFLDRPLHCNMPQRLFQRNPFLDSPIGIL